MASADKYVPAIPMWNFGIPYRLKQNINILVQPGYTFSYNADKRQEAIDKAKEIGVVF